LEYPILEWRQDGFLAIDAIPAAVQEKEKKLLDGFLTGKARLREESQKTAGQRRLFD